MKATRNKEEERRKIFMILGGSFLLVLVFAAAAYFEYGRVKKIRSKIETVESQITTAETKRMKIPRLEKDVIVLRENVAEYVQILPDDREVNDFVTRINQFADLAGVVVTTLEDVVRRTAGKKKDPFERVAYKLNFTGEIDQVMSFMSHFENHERFVKIPSFTVKAGKKKKKEGAAAEIRHEIDMLLETFVYDGGSLHNKVTIPSFEGKRSKFEAEIIEARKDLSIETYPFTVNEHRRDPFLDPRISSTDAQAMTLAKEQQALGELEDELATIHELIATESAEKDLIKKSELRRLTDDAIRGLLALVETAREEVWFTISALREELEEKVAQKLAAIIEERGLAPEAEPLTVADLRELQVHMKSLFDQGSYEDVIEEFDGLVPRIDPAEQYEDFHAALDDIVTMKEHAVAILDFQEREIRVDGIVFRPGGSTVIVNGLVLVSGDPVDDEVYIAAIHEDEIEFLFRDIRISKLIHE